MPEIRYSPKDTVVLKPRTRGEPSRGTGIIVAVLPETQGSVRYRVRLQNENFDRSIGYDDIDAEASSSSHKLDARSAASRKAGSSWIDLSAIRTRK